MIGDKIMPKKREAEWYTTSTGTEYPAAKKEYDAKYEKAQDSIRVRMPAGYNQLLKDYVAANKDKYKSVNALIKHLVDQELGLTEEE